MTLIERVRELSTLLAMPDSDFWYDVGCADARLLLDAGGDQLYGELLVIVKNMSPVQQEHLAYILGETESAREIAILDLLENSEHADVAYRAREALRGISGS